MPGGPNLDKSQILTAKKDPNLCFVEANEFLLTCAGFASLDEAVGANDEDCSWSEYSHFYRQHELDALNGDVYGAIQPTKTTFSDFFWVYNYKYPTFDAAGEITGVSVYAHEVLNPAWVTFANYLKQLDRYGCEQFFVGRKIGLDLTKRESVILFFLLRGLTSRQISKVISISVRTVETHIEKIKSKMNCRTRAQLIEYAADAGITKIIPDGMVSAMLVRNLKNI